MIPDDEDECADRANRSSHQRETGDMAHATASQSGPDRTRRTARHGSARRTAPTTSEERSETRCPAKYCKTRT